MRRCVFALIAALAAGSGVAQPGDPMKSKECRQALDALQEQENKATAEGGRQQPGSLKQLEPFRRDAARACLGGRGDPEPLSSRFAQPPNAVSPAPVRTPAQPSPRAIVPPPPVTQPAPPPLVVTGCDATGCWASDGSRLPRVGPDLLSPRGLCTVHGAVLRCP
jgi:hypothetical protein